MKRHTLSPLIVAVFIAGASSAIAQDEVRGGGKGHNMPVFSDFDLNADGKIVADEFYQARSKRMAERAANGGKMRNAANAPSFEDIDVDGDGKVSAKEFSAHKAKRRAKNRRQKAQRSGN